MKNRRNIYSAVAYLPILLVILATSCNDKNDFPDKPEIISINFEAVPSNLVVEFTDGDGDFGLGDQDLADFPPYLDNDSTQRNPFFYNYWLDLFELLDGEWVQIEPAEGSTFNARIKVLTPEGQNKQLEVKITNDLSLELPSLVQSDTVKFRVTLVDRARNQSVPRETEPIYLPR